jgi:hypothetical protein
VTKLIKSFNNTSCSNKALHLGERRVVSANTLEAAATNYWDAKVSSLHFANNSPQYWSDVQAAMIIVHANDLHEVTNMVTQIREHAGPAIVIVGDTQWVLLMLSDSSVRYLISLRGCFRAAFADPRVPICRSAAF